MIWYGARRGATIIVGDASLGFAAFLSTRAAAAAFHVAACNGYGKMGQGCSQAASLS
jgi:hypothetical protein